MADDPHTPEPPTAVRPTSVRLTQTAKRAGCAAKHPPGYLLPLLENLPAVTDPRVLIGSNTADDAAVIRIAPAKSGSSRQRLPSRPEPD